MLGCVSLLLSILPKLPSQLHSNGQTTLAIWTAIKKYTLKRTNKQHYLPIVAGNEIPKCALTIIKIIKLLSNGITIIFSFNEIAVHPSITLLFSSIIKMAAVQCHKDC